ncbi:MAG: ion transporter [Candidatus Riflebacteria bacterium]
MSNGIKFLTEVENRPKPYRLLRELFDSAWFSSILIFLILASVALIIVETFVPMAPLRFEQVQQANDLFTLIFIIELSLRWLISTTTRNFLATFWIDILAVMPMLRVFRLGRVLRLLRLFRIFSLGANVQRRFSIFNRLFEGRWVEYCVIASFVVFAVFFGAVGLSQFETGISKDILDPVDAFWKSLFSLLAGEYADYPQSLGGKAVFLTLLIFQMGVFAMLTGTFSAIMVEKLKETTMHKPASPDELNNHVMICGYSSKVAVLVQEFLLDPIFASTEILLISEKADLADLRAKKINTDRISVLKEDFTKMEVLKKGGVMRAVVAVILSEPGENRTTQDIDARTILAALTIEKLNPKIHTSAELYNEEYASHLKMGGVDDVVIQGEFSGKLLAKVAAHEGVLAFFKDLLSRESGNTLSFIEPPEKIINMDVGEANLFMQREFGYLIVAIKPEKQELIVNPRRHKISSSDKILIINPVN